MSEQVEEVGISTPLGSISTKGKKTSEIIAILCLSLLFLLGYAFWEHKAEAKENGNAMVKAFTEIAQSNRVLACLMATPQEQRPLKLPECERIAR